MARAPRGGSGPCAPGAGARGPAPPLRADPASAEGAGFEPAVRGCRTPVFKTGAFDHSATPPGARAMVAGAVDPRPICGRRVRCATLF